MRQISVRYRDQLIRIANTAATNKKTITRASCPSNVKVVERHVPAVVVTDGAVYLYPVVVWHAVCGDGHKAREPGRVPLVTRVCEKRMVGPCACVL